MERNEVVFHVAVSLRATVCGKDDLALSAEHLVGRLCESLHFDIIQTPECGSMLGGAYARLQLDDADAPEDGGLIWVRDSLPPERGAFAVAHELGHFVLHRGERVALHRECDEFQVDESADPLGLRVEDHRVEEYSKHVRRELEANAFAAELLAPRSVVRQLFGSERSIHAAELAQRFGISETLAKRRLLDAVLAPNTLERGEPPDAQAHGAGTTTDIPAHTLLDTLDPFQRAAACADGPAVVVAGPGTGKTATLVGRVAHLVTERGHQPERILALTFSNRAAGEMRERLIVAGLPGERMPVMTIHAFATSLLREYAHQVPHAPDEPELRADFRILDAADSFLLMEDLLAELPLHYYRSLGNPVRHARTLLSDFSQARDALLTPDDYLALVNAMRETREPDDSAAISQSGPGYTSEQIAKARERALAYGVWDRAQRRRGVIDFGGLIQRAVELLRDNQTVREDVHERYAEILVDEFQDTNRAAGELLTLVAGDSGKGLWVVGDRNQSIYRWRGASATTLLRLSAAYPGLHVHTLRRCYRSVPAIVRLGSDVAARMAEREVAPTNDATMVGDTSSRQQGRALERALAPVALEAVRSDGTLPAVWLGERFTSDTHERAGLAAAIQRNHMRGVPYGGQAVLCRTRKQVAQITDALEAERIPVGQLGGLFNRAEVKDALALLSLSAGPDARGVLRAGALSQGVDGAPLRPRDLALALRVLVRARRPLPAALAELDAIPGVEALPVAARQSLAELGRVAQSLRYAPALSVALADYLLRPGGYAWRLLRIASAAEVVYADISRAEASTALAALGELVRLVARFDLRWSGDDDFRRQLMRAVRHTSRPQRASMPHVDAVESGPRADVVETTPETPASDAHEATAPAVRCFLHYLSALRSAEAEITVPAGAEDSVHVLTLHASKGLEFPVVYLPGLADGQFPARHSGPEEVCPDGFREVDAPGERESEERCLFYVGLTRARDSVVFTRATRYGKSANSGPSPHFTLLEGAAAFAAASPLFSDDELAALPGAVVCESVSDGIADVAPMCADAAETAHVPRQRSYSLHELEQYIECPRQYKYARVYNLLDPAEDAVHRFHRYLYRARRELRVVREAAPAAGWEAAEARLRELWETDGPAGHAYDAFYWRHARGMLRAEWASLGNGSADALPGLVPADELVAALRGCVVRVTADRMPAGAPGAASADCVTLARFHSGRPAKSHADDLALPLYALAHLQRRSGEAVRIELLYPVDSLDEAELPEQEGQSVPVAVDVTAEACKVANAYVTSNRKRRSKLDKLDEAAAGIEAGQFAPKPDEGRCATCAFCYVCPADPDALLGESPSRHVSTRGGSEVGLR